MKIADTLEGYRKQIKQMKRLKTCDILDQTIDEDFLAKAKTVQGIVDYLKEKGC